MIGGVTPFGLPDDLPLYIDARVMTEDTRRHRGRQPVDEDQARTGGIAAASRSTRRRRAGRASWRHPGMTRLSAAAAHIVKADPAFRRIVETSRADGRAPPKRARRSNPCSAPSCSSSLPAPRREPSTGGLSRCLAARRSCPRPSSPPNPKPCVRPGSRRTSWRRSSISRRNSSTGRCRPTTWTSLSDDEIVARLVTVRGVGPLDRRDVPALPAAPSRRVAGGRPRRPQRLGAHPRHGGAADCRRRCMLLGESLRPYRSTAAWYCWRAAAPVPGRGHGRRPRPALKAAGRRPPSRPKKA